MNPPAPLADQGAVSILAALPNIRHSLSFPRPRAAERHGWNMYSSGLQFDVDFIEELRLRRWARENYVPANERNTTWHPIILEEMHSKDGEVSEAVLVS